MRVKVPYPWQEAQWQLCKRQLQQQKFPHALLLHGENGLGIAEFADNLIYLLLCRNQETSSCGHCNACMLLQSANHPDYCLLDIQQGSYEITVDKIRQAIDFTNISTHYERGKILLIQSADLMNHYAANSLLKTLEEPSANCIIILVTENLHKILPTIRSRCQMLRFIAPQSTQLIHWLSQNTDLSEVEIESHLENLQLKPLEDVKLLNSLSTKSLNNQNGDDKEVINQYTFIEDLEAMLQAGREANVLGVSSKYKHISAEQVQGWLLDKLQQHITQYYSNENNKLLNKLYVLYDRQIDRFRKANSTLNSEMMLENALLEWKAVFTQRFKAD